MATVEASYAQVRNLTSLRHEPLILAVPIDFILSRSLLSRHFRLCPFLSETGRCGLGHPCLLSRTGAYLDGTIPYRLTAGTRSPPC
jgi:hypothetical protein